MYEYVGDRLAVSRAEPEWDDDERGLMLALAEVEGDECPGCHGPLVETTAPENERAYIVKPPVRCHRCTALAVAADKHRGAGEVRHEHALLWVAEKR